MDLYVVLGWVIVFGAIGALIGENKGIGGWGFALGALLGPIGLIFLLAARGKRHPCPFCRKLIADGASSCPHCHHEFGPQPNVACIACGKPHRVEEALVGHVARCPNCGKVAPTRPFESETPAGPSRAKPSGPVLVKADGRLIEDEEGFFQAVVGESHHQRVLQLIKQGARRKEGHLAFTAFLLPDPTNAYDSNAIAVCHRTAGQVGYLPREDAARFRPLADRLYAKGLCIACPARLTGGAKPKPFIGVTLSLPSIEKAEEEFAENTPAKAGEQTSRDSTSDQLISEEELRGLLREDGSAKD